jgi:hypothetical protein
MGRGMKGMIRREGWWIGNIGEGTKVSRSRMREEG